MTIASLPPPISVDLSHDDLRQYWVARAAQHTRDTYAGIPLSKFPEDLRVYEHLLWLDTPDTVIEIGTQFGASALWFRDRLRTLQSYGRLQRLPQVVTVDVDQSRALAALADIDPHFSNEIVVIEADVRDPATPERVAAVVRDDARCLVVDDSAHTEETTSAALRGFSRFVSAGGFFVVEDGCVDIEAMRIDPGWPRGVLPALTAWLLTHAGSRFEIRRDLEIYGITCHPQGFLQRTQD